MAALIGGDGQPESGSLPDGSLIVDTRTSCLGLIGLLIGGAVSIHAQSIPAPTVETILARMAQARIENRTRLRPYTVIRDYQLGDAFGVFGELNTNLSFAALRKGVFQRIGYQLIDNQPTGNRGVQRQVQPVELRPETNPLLAADAIGAEQILCKLPDVLRKIDLREIFRLVQALVQQRHRVDAILAFLEHLAHLRIGNRPRLKTKQAGHHLEIILHPVVNLFQERLLVTQ